jgi:hypothetical protein
MGTPLSAALQEWGLADNSDPPEYLDHSQDKIDAFLKPPAAANNRKGREEKKKKKK